MTQIQATREALARHVYEMFPTQRASFSLYGRAITERKHRSWRPWRTVTYLVTASEVTELTPRVPAKLRLDGGSILVRFDGAAEGVYVFRDLPPGVYESLGMHNEEGLVDLAELVGNDLGERTLRNSGGTVHCRNIRFDIT